MTDGSDLDWLGLHRIGPGHWAFTATPELSRLDGKFYGGTGIAVSTAVMEAETGRQALWASVQFAASANEDDRFDCRIQVLAAGRRTSQVQVTGSVGERVVFTALGATGDAKPGAHDAQFGEMPAVTPPEESPPWQPRMLDHLGGSRPGWLAITDTRMANDEGAMWMRLVDRPLTRPGMAFVADIVPSGVVRAAGRTGAGTSLDNAMRFGPEPEGDWLLVDVDPQLISRGYVHGAARLWSSSGRLLGVAGQTASLILFD